MLFSYVKISLSSELTTENAIILSTICHSNRPLAIAAKQYAKISSLSCFSLCLLHYYTRFSLVCQLKYRPIYTRPHIDNIPNWNRTSLITHISSFLSTLFTIYFTIHLLQYSTICYYYLIPFDHRVIWYFKASRTNVRRVMGSYGVKRLDKVDKMTDHK